jgi:uncharacterized membrane protein
MPELKRRTAELAKMRLFASVAGLLCAGEVCAGKNCPPVYAESYFASPDQCGWPSFDVPNVTPVSINNVGGVIGHSSTAFCLDGKKPPFYWTPAEGFVKPALPANFTSATLNDLSDKGVSVGQKTGGGTVAVVLQAGNWTVLPLWPGDTVAEAAAVNSSGTIVGESHHHLLSGWKAIMWKDGEMINISPPGVPKARAWDINEAGHVVATVGTSGFSGQAKPYIWQDGEITYVPLPRNALGADNLKINDHGNVAGRWYYKKGDVTVKAAFVWIDGVFTDIDIFEGCSDALLKDFNDRNEAVGDYDTCDGFDGFPFVWVDGCTWNLNELLGYEHPYDLAWVSSINDLGQIACPKYADVTREDGALGVMTLTPVPQAISDTNCDQVVDGEDLASLLKVWDTDDYACDLNDDGRVDGADLGILLGEWTGVDE